MENMHSSLDRWLFLLHISNNQYMFVLGFFFVFLKGIIELILKSQ